MSRYFEIDNPKHCPSAMFLYDEEGVAVTRVCEKLWYAWHELKVCDSSQFPEYCQLRDVK